MSVEGGQWGAQDRHHLWCKLWQLLQDMVIFPQYLLSGGCALLKLQPLQAH